MSQRVEALQKVVEEIVRLEKAKGCALIIIHESGPSEFFSGNRTDVKDFSELLRQAVDSGAAAIHSANNAEQN